MTKCPRCSTVLSETEQQKCNACGLSTSQEVDQIIQQPPQDDDADHTPTRIKETKEDDPTPTKLKKTKPQNEVHVTTSDSGRFVAGTVLADRYRILGLLGKGGMGDVYKAEDLETTIRIVFYLNPAK